MSLSSVIRLERTAVVAPSSAAGELARSGEYVARLATTDEQRDAIYRLRFQVFNLELQEGLDSAFVSERDVDEFDHFCDHVLIEHAPTGEAIGTYRMQPGAIAERALGYYSEREFEFAPYRQLSHELVELGRACVVREHRSYEVLVLLWKAVAMYAQMNNARYLIGCSSMASQEPSVGWSLYRRLRDNETCEALRTVPTFAYELPEAAAVENSARIPKLLRAYLAIGAKICGPPALDREFKTIDFLTLLDTQNMPATARAHFFQ